MAKKTLLWVCKAVLVPVTCYQRAFQVRGSASATAEGPRRGCAPRAPVPLAAGELRAELERHWLDDHGVHGRSHWPVVGV